MHDSFEDDLNTLRECRDFLLEVVKRIERRHAKNPACKLDPEDLAVYQELQKIEQSIADAIDRERKRVSGSEGDSGLGVQSAIGMVKQPSPVHKHACAAMQR